ncbi:PD40 domain-containing protein [Terriglobus albidus]|uniref:PD40 domain-containing protein n=1 Tax=Terriglobus albidus TaxID=1592106 RepID=UPI00164E51F7|nr:PD40 domain-containing protein [Terriglobus albidus]
MNTDPESTFEAAEVRGRRGILDMEATMIVLDQTKLRAQVERLAASAEFARADRMVQFLRYVVAKTLEGDTVALRERQIGISVFERPSDWDPKTDNIVRSEARRLRGKLEAYAASNDPDETVRITMPTGGYGVHFEELASDVAPVEQPVISPVGAPTVPLGQPAAGAENIRRPQSGLLRGNRVWLLPICVVVLLSVLFVAFHYWPGTRSRDDEYEIEPFSAEAGLQFSPAISPDSKTIAFVWNGGGNQFDIYSKSVASAELQRLTHDSLPSIHPAWSPDGKQLAFLRETGAELPQTGAGGEAQLIVLDTVTHRERLVRRMQDSLGMWGSSNPLAGCQTLSWSSHGDQLILTDPSGETHRLISISSLTGEQKTISSPGGSDQDCYARLSPDGKTIAFVRLISHAVGYLYTVDVTGDHLNRLTRDVKDLRGVGWTPDGSHLVFASKERGVYQLRTISVQGGESSPLPAATASAADPSVSPNGKFVVFVENHENWNIWRLPLKGDEIGTPQRFLASTGQNHSPSFSPDGRTIAFVSDRSGSPEIWLCDNSGQQLRQLTHFAGPWLGTIRWSPDSSSIVFDARPKGHSAIFKMAVNQGKPELVEDQPPFEVRRPSWSRDGRYIYFDTTRGGAPAIWRRDLQTNQNQVIAPAGFMIGIESPDGKRLFYQENEQRHVWVSDPDGSSPRQLSQVSPTPDLDWTLIGTSVYFASSTSTGGTDILAFDLSNEKLKKLGHVSQNLALGTPSFVISPDGLTLLYAAIDNSSSEIKLRRGALPR